MEVRVPMEMNMGKFSEKLVGLLELAKKKKNVLEYQEISDYFKDQPLDAEQMDKIFDFLEASGVDVLRITENSADDLMLDDDMDIDGLDDEEEVELDKIDLSVPEGVSIEDPVRMYLKEIGISRSQLQRKLKQLTNQNPSDYIKTTRLRHAAWLLSCKNLSVSEVSYATGFSSLSHFSNSFKEFYGMSPSHYMEIHRSNRDSEKSKTGK